MKDNFSDKSHNYKKFRPDYPIELFEFVTNLSINQDRALDCGTGNGQIASHLTAYFKEVYAIDISRAQLEHSPLQKVVHYSVQMAENTTFPSLFFDLITVGQAVHWFDLPKFFAEADRILKPGGVLALIGYQLPRISPALDKMLDDYYARILGEYWDPERKHIDNQYRDICFPYPEIPTPIFSIELHWSFADFMGYLGTWSALKHFMEKKQKNPLNELQNEIISVWAAEKEKYVKFPLFMRIGMKSY